MLGFREVFVDSYLVARVLERVSPGPEDAIAITSGPPPVIKYALIIAGSLAHHNVKDT
jgi:hypothetical protein